jgi:hypothetical protein
MSIDVRQVGTSSWELAFSTHAPCEVVYDYVLDVERHGEWEDDLTEVTHRSGARGRAGGLFVKTYGHRPQGFLKRMFSDAVQVECEITAAERPYRIDWQQRISRKGADGHDVQRFELTLTPLASGCRFALVRTPSDATSVQMISSFMGRADDEFDRQPGARERLAEVGDSGLGASSGEMIGRLLQGLPARGPGSSSLERLRDITDSWR